MSWRLLEILYILPIYHTVRNAMCCGPLEVLDIGELTIPDTPFIRSLTDAIEMAAKLLDDYL